MKESPVLFNSDMVRAILEGQKTETRRVIKPQPYIDQECGSLPPGKYWFWRTKTNVWGGFEWTENQLENEISEYIKCPYGQIRDRLWVKETICIYPDGNGNPVCVYKATDKKPDTDLWTPSIYMPRTASRITLEITEIKVGRVQEIDNDGATEEGISQYFVDCNEDGYWDVPAHWKNPDGKIIKRVQADSPVEAFCNLWDSIYKKRGFSWESNPWVWCIKFKRIEV